MKEENVTNSILKWKKKILDSRFISLKIGQLCLITDSRTNSDRSNKSVILPPGELNINVTKKPYHYTKKWVDNLTDNFSLSASHILKERVWRNTKLYITKDIYRCQSTVINFSVIIIYHLTNVINHHLWIIMTDIDQYRPSSIVLRGLNKFLHKFVYLNIYFM